MEGVNFKVWRYNETVNKLLIQSKSVRTLKKSQRSILIIISSITVIGVLFCLANAHKLVVFWVLWTSEPYVEKTSEELFAKFVLEDSLQPSSGTRILGGLQRVQFFVPLKGPVYIRFKTDDVFRDELVNRKSQFFEPYTEISCKSFFKVTQDAGDAQRYPQKFAWWLPADVAAPVCYRSASKLPVYEDEAKYLLVDSEHTEIYFFRTVTPQLAVN